MVHIIDIRRQSMIRTWCECGVKGNHFKAADGESVFFFFRFEAFSRVSGKGLHLNHVTSNSLINNLLFLESLILRKWHWLRPKQQGPLKQNMNKMSDWIMKWRKCEAGDGRPLHTSLMSAVLHPSKCTVYEVGSLRRLKARGLWLCSSPSLHTIKLMVHWGGPFQLVKLEISIFTTMNLHLNQRQS